MIIQDQQETKIAVSQEDGRYNRVRYPSPLGLYKHLDVRGLSHLVDSLVQGLNESTI